MKCPECKTKIRKKNNGYCPSCERKLLPEEIQKARRKKKTIGWIFGGIAIAFALIIIVFALMIFLPTDIYFVDASISSDRLEYGESLDISLTYEGIGVLKAETEIPVYIDGELVETSSFAFSGTGEITNEFSVETLDVYEPGTYVLEIEGDEVPFKILTPADLRVDCSAQEEIYLVGKEYTVDYTVLNKGESSENCRFDIEFNDELIGTEEFFLEGNSEKVFECSVSSDDEGVRDLVIAGADFPIEFFQSARLNSGDKLMENTVKGYSYFVINNELDTDIVIMITTLEAPENAVGACYVRSGDEVKFRSFVHGNYLVFLQKGDSWVPEKNRFAENEEYHILNGYYDLDNAMYGGYGSYSYVVLDITQSMLDTEFTRIYDEIPNLVFN